MLTISFVFCATGTSRRTKKGNLTYSAGLGGGNSKSKKSLWLSDDDFDVVEGSSDEEDNPAHLSGRIFHLDSLVVRCLLREEIQGSNPDFVSEVIAMT